MTLVKELTLCSVTCIIILKTLTIAQDKTKTITLSGTYIVAFLIAGHTKFGPNRSFGIIKRVYKVNFVSSLYEFAEMVGASSTIGVNKAQLVGTHDACIIVPT